MTSLPQIIDESIRSGSRLAGDDFTPAEIEKWFAEEKEAYFEYDNGDSRSDPYYALMRRLNDAIAFSLIRKRFSGGAMLVLGPGSGAEVASVGADLNWDITFIESSESFRLELVKSFPRASVKEALPTGDLDALSSSVDVAVAFSVLHHVPNVSKVLGEFFRILRPGGLLIIREPCSSMGDWRLPRDATPNERGISRSWMVQKANALGFMLFREPVPILTYPLSRLFYRVGLRRLVDSRFFFRLDLSVSRILASNDRYWRDSVLSKLAPGSYFYVFSKP